MRDRALPTGVKPSGSRTCRDRGVSSRRKSDNWTGQSQSRRITQHYLAVYHWLARSQPERRSSHQAECDNVLPTRKLNACDCQRALSVWAAGMTHSPWPSSHSHTFSAAAARPRDDHASLKKRPLLASPNVIGQITDCLNNLFSLNIDSSCVLFSWISWQN